jgi:hypothetical protein
LANQPIVGKLTVFTVYFIIIGLTGYLVGLTIRHLTKTYRTQSATLWIVQAVFIWALMEAFIAWAVAIIWIGRGGRADAILPFFSSAPLLAFTPLNYLTRFVGYFGLSAVFGVGVAVILLRKTRRYAPHYWLVVLMVTGLAWGLYRTPSGPTVHATIVAEELGKQHIIDVGQSQFVVLPEYGLDDYTSSDSPRRFTPSTREVFFVGSQQRDVRTGYQNVLLFGSTSRGFIQQLPKDRLIPGGEYLAYWVCGLLQIASPSTYSDFQVRRQVEKGTHSASPFQINQQTIVGAAVCSSIIAPKDYRLLTQQGATVLTNSASLEIFRGSRLFNVQHRGFSKFIATANARPFLQSSNNWQAFALDSNGHQLSAIDPESTRTITVQTNTKRTPYSYLGEWMSIGGALLVVGQGTMSLLNQPKKKQPQKKKKR